jgi:UPF0755 protein
MGKLRAMAVVAGFLFFATSFFQVINPDSGRAPDYQSGHGTGSVMIEISEGDTGSMIAQQLFEKGVVKSSLAFFREAVANPKSTRIAPGSHEIEQRLSAREALEQLLDTERIKNLIKIRDGAWLSEVMALLYEDGHSRAEVKKALDNLVLPDGFTAQSVEGMLYPAFYSFSKEARAEQKIQAMINRFVSALDTLEFQPKNDFSRDQILIIASLIEAEGTPDIFPKVSRVIYNRLSKRMPLQFDASINYILSRRGNISVSLRETTLKNPFNTYANTGLPPAPIGNASLPALRAALDPADGDWIYFVTVAPKVTKFTADYDEFLEYKAEYKRNLRLGKFDQ